MDLDEIVGKRKESNETYLSNEQNFLHPFFLGQLAEVIPKI